MRLPLSVYSGYNLITINLLNEKTMNKTNDKQKYQPNVTAFLDLCGRNYVHIMTCLPNLTEIGKRWAINGIFGHLTVTLLENTPYTQLIELSRFTTDCDLVPVPKITVRLYHDAKLAEVLTVQQISQFKPVYDYPNLCMYQRDEKYQINAFLEELLKIGKQAHWVCLS